MQKLYDFARGTVRLNITGAQPERMLNALAMAGIMFWDCDPADGCTVKATIYSEEYEKAARLAARCMCEITPENFRGGKKVGRAILRRKALLLCAAVFALALAWSSLYVWDIEIVGNQAVSSGTILRALEENGVSTGTFWPGISTEMVEAGVMPELPDIAWMTVNVRSSRVVVKIKERTVLPEKVDEDVPANVKAEKTGIVMKMSVLQGAPSVHPGDAVLRGETLVSGAMESQCRGTRAVHAQADVISRTLYELNAVCPASETKKTPKGRAHSRFAVMIGRKRINFYAGSRKEHALCDKIIKKYTLSVPGAFTLPVTLIRETFAPYAVKSADSAPEAELKADLMACLKAELSPGGSILSATYSQSRTGGLVRVTLRAECTENIAATVPMTPEELESIDRANLQAEKDRTNDRTDH